MAAPGVPPSFHEFIDALPEDSSGKAAALRIPPEAGGVQINFCKNPACANYGIPVEPTSRKGKQAHGNPNRYKIVGSGRGLPSALCGACGESFSLKSNQGIVEERDRLRPKTAEPCCPDEACSNHGVGVSAGKPFYSSFGKTSAGSSRWKCMACSKTFSAAAKSTSRQRMTHKNKEVFALLVNKTPMRRIIEITGLSPQTVYDKIDFIRRQCVAFAADREAKLPDLALRRLYIGVDKQDYAINWTKREDRRNVVLSAAAFVDNDSGYAFGTWLNFDPEADAPKIEKEARSFKQMMLPVPFRRHARLWTAADYAASVQASLMKGATGSLASAIAQEYAAAARRTDSEASDLPTKDDRLPEAGMQVHSEYLLYGSFLRLREMLGSTEKVRFFLDQDSGMRAACLGAWADRIKAGTCDAFYVRIAKERTVDQKRLLAAQARDEIKQAMAALGCSKSDAILAVLKQRIAQAQAFGKWNDRWVFHPNATMSEPEKAVCHLTDRPGWDPDHLAWLYNRASLHGVDSFFNRVRRRVSPLERGIHSQANAGRVWNGYAPYKPAQIQALLDIFRVCHNYMWTRAASKSKSKTPEEKANEKKTPAMLLGLAKGVVSYEDVLYFK
ncbi:hypothetical protein GALL_04060 [mine drainage metagenome]|uniref:C2H2-type domain-containing protein n=1 Tax=mine drainage metagenome TaxID=410659 RepID=A0A1J5TT15_9ZZZZ